MKTWNKPIFTTLEIAETECYNYGPVFEKPRYPKRKPCKPRPSCRPSYPGSNPPVITEIPEEPENFNS